MCRIVLGKTYIDKDEENIVTSKEFTEMIEEVFFLNGVLDIRMQFYGLLSWIYKGMLREWRMSAQEAW